MSYSYWNRFKKKSGFWNALKRRYKFGGNEQVYLTGDYTASLNMALSFKNNQNFGKYNLITNNCLDYVQTLLKYGTNENSFVLFLIPLFRLSILK